MPIVPHIVGKFHLVVPGVTDPRDHDGIRAALTDHAVFGKAFSRDGGLLTLTPARPQQPTPGQLLPPETLLVPVRPIELGSLEIRAVQLPAEGERPSGRAVAIRCPEDLIRIHAAEVQSHGHTRYRWDKFLQSLKEDYDAEIGRGMRSVLAARMNGLQGQAWTGDPRINQLGPDVVGIGRMLARRLARILDVEAVDGLWVLLQRYPVASPGGARWVQVVVLQQAMDELIRVHGEAWARLHLGDADGDVAYLGCQGVHFGKVIVAPAFDRLVLADTRPLLDELVTQFLTG